MRALGYFAGPQGRRAPRALDGDLSDAGQGRVAGQGRAHRRPDVSSDADDVRVPRVALGPRPTVRAGLGDGRLHVPRREGPRDVAPGDEAVQRDVAGVAQVPQPLGRRDARRPRVRASEDVAPVLDERPVGLERELRPAPLPVDAERFASRRVPLDALRRPVEHEELLVGDREAHAAVALDVLAGRDFAHSPSRQGGHRSSFFATRCAARTLFCTSLPCSATLRGDAAGRPVRHDHPSLAGVPSVAWACWQRASARATRRTRRTRRPNNSAALGLV